MRFAIRSVMVCMLVMLLAAGCSAGDGEQPGTTAPEAAGPTAEDAAAAFEATHPGFSAMDVTEEGTQWIVTGQSDIVPEFWIRTWVAPVPDGDVTAMIDGTEWSAERALQEVTENAGLMPLDMREQFMRAVVDYVGIEDADHPGGFVTSVGVVSNVEMSVGFSGDTGDLNFLTFKLDLASGDWVPAP